jgi:hypothetical protein
MEITKNQVQSFFVMLFVMLALGCVIFYLLVSATSSVTPVWVIGGIVAMIFYVVGYIVRWITAKKKTA